MRLRFPLLLVALAGCVVLGVASANTAGTAVSGKITKLADGTPLPGAVVTVAGPHQPPITATTGADGNFSIVPTGDGPYGVGVSAAGYKSRAIAGVSAGALDPIALAPATSTPLPVYAGRADSVVADAESGIFYALMGGGSGPEVYRTVDYGGSWRPVTMSYDDPAAGLSNSIDGSAIAAGGVSGEVAVAAAPFHDCAHGIESFPVSFSTDYGLAWRKLSGASYHQGECPLPSERLRLFWGHAKPGAPDVLLAALQRADGSWKVWRADMSAASPAFVEEASDPFGQGAQIAVADSTNGSFIGRVSSDGALSFAPLTASGQLEFGQAQVTGLPSLPVLLRLGGAREPAAPPDGALVVGGSGPYQAVMLTKSAGAESFSGASLAAPTDLPDRPNPDNCGFGRLSYGSVTPTTTGSAGAGNAGTCWLQKSGTGNPLIVSPQTVAGGSDMAYDAGYGQTGDLVSIQPSMGGPMKWAKLDSNGAPAFTDANKLATVGTDPESGGTSIRGITSPIVEDTAYGPAGAGEVAVAAAEVMMASTDGGKTFTEVLSRGRGAPSNAVEWWQGQSGEWLVFGHGFNCDEPLLSAVRNWDGVSTLSEPNVGGSGCADLGGPPEGYWGTGGYVVGALAPVPGTDTVFIGLGTSGEEKYGNVNHVYRAQLAATDSPQFADLAKLDPSPAVATLYLPMAMAYCPDTSSVAAAMRDVLFVATTEGGGSFGGALLPFGGAKGALLRITGATTGSPSVSVVDSVPHDAATTGLVDVRADCAKGVVYAGGVGLYESVDGGQTFARITILQADGTPVVGVTAIGLNPADPNDVTVAGGEGAVFHSSDGGTSWTLVHDPSVDRPAQVNDIEFASGASSPTILGSSAVQRAVKVRKAAGATHKLALVGTSSGAFDGDLAATSGLMGVSARAGQPRGSEVRITTLASDNHPALAAARSGKAWAVFHRSNGLYLSAASNGSWSIPGLVPGTNARDDFPAAVLDRAGRVSVAFARKGRGAGIYLTTRSSSGAWSAPRRLSSHSGDTLPAIGVTASAKPRIQIVFQRTRGSARGLYYVSSKGKSWSRAARVRGSTAADARPALGGPALDARSNRLELAFARAGRGIYLAELSGSSWSALKRLSSGPGDSQPSLAIDAGGKVHIVFRRPLGHGAHGLYELQGKKAWSLRQIPKTVSADREASLSVSGSSLVLTFARPSGKAAGVYYDRVARGHWLAKPQRWSKSAKDRNPSLRSGAQGRVAVVFERG